MDEVISRAAQGAGGGSGSQERLDHRPERVVDEGFHALQTTSSYLLKRTLKAQIGVKE